MKKILILPLLLLLFSCYEQERNCKDFKLGTFEFSQELDGKKRQTSFVRTETLQIETFEEKTDTATVRWINDCEFILQKLHPKNRQEKKAISMKIVQTNGKKYTFEYSFVGEDKKKRGTVTKIE
jgi:hypothetical protein